MASLAGASVVLQPACAQLKVVKLDRVICRLLNGPMGYRRLKSASAAVDNGGSVDKGGKASVIGGEKNIGLKLLCEKSERLREMLVVVPPRITMAGQSTVFKFVSGSFVIFAFLLIFAKKALFKNQRTGYQGSINDLVKRGHLNPHDRRGMSRQLLYSDPFNNSLVRVNKDSSTVQMFGKTYRMAPVTLTKEQQSVHQQRRSRAYQWKRPTIFLKEGDSIPPDVDPDLVRWIPSNHPFASSSSDIDEELAKRNLDRKDGIPSRVKAEQEMLLNKLDALKGDLENGAPANLTNGNKEQQYTRPSASVQKQHEQS